MAQGKRRGFEGGVVSQAAEKPRGPAGSHRKGFHGVRNQAKVRKRWLVNYLGHGVEQLSSGFRGVGLVRMRDIGVAIDASLVLLPSLRLLTTVSVGARVLLLVTGDFLLILVVTHAGGRVVVLYRLGPGGGSAGGARWWTRDSRVCAMRSKADPMRVSDSWIMERTWSQLGGLAGLLPLGSGDWDPRGVRDLGRWGPEPRWCPGDEVLRALLRGGSGEEDLEYSWPYPSLSKRWRGVEVAHVRGKRTFVPREEAGLNSLW